MVQTIKKTTALQAPRNSKPVALAAAVPSKKAKKRLQQQLKQTELWMKAN